MYQGKTVFSQIMTFISKYEFKKIVDSYGGDYKTRRFTCWNQLLSMAFAQLTYRESLRDLETCLEAQSQKQYHLGFRSKVSKSTLADANEKRDWRIYQDYAQLLIREAIELYSENEFSVELKNAVYAIDSTTIDLCLSLFPWAKFRKKKGAVKLHTLLNLRGYIPVIIHITDGLTHDVNFLDELIIEPGAFYIMDRAYIDFKRLYRISENNAYFVTRTKTNFKFKRLYSNTVNKKDGVKCDQIIKLAGFYSSKNNPEKLRRIKFYDIERDSQILLLTNNFSLPAKSIADLYRKRWKIEIFFKWIKQHLRIKAFYGTSENAVKTQIWIAISIYVLIAIIKKRLNIEISLYKILQILSVTIFEKQPINQLLKNFKSSNKNDDLDNQLNLFNL